LEGGGLLDEVLGLDEIGPGGLVAGGVGHGLTSIGQYIMVEVNN
jgi:hypothetical protein